MALIVSGSSLGAGIIDISNDEGWPFEVYSSGTSYMNIIGSNMDVDVWMTGAMANVQWAGRIPYVWQSFGSTYMLPSGIKPDETSVEFEEVMELGDFHGLGFVSGYLFTSYNILPSPHSLIMKIGILSNATNSGIVELPYHPARFAVLDENTVYVECYAGEYVDMLSFYKIDFITGTATRLYTYVQEDQEMGADGFLWVRYTSPDAWAAISTYEGKKYYIALSLAHGYSYYARFFVYDIVNNRLVSNDYIEFNQVADLDFAAGHWYNKPTFYKNKVVFTINAIYSYNENDAWPPMPYWEYPFPTIIFDMTDESITRISPGLCYDYTDWFFDTLGCGMDKETGIYYYGEWIEHDRPSAGPFKLYAIDLANPSYDIIYDANEGVGFSVYGGIKHAFLMQNNGVVYDLPGISNIGIMNTSDFHYSQLFYDESDDTVWSMHYFDADNITVDGHYIWGDGLNGSPDKVINLNHDGQIFNYEYERMCSLYMLARNVCIIGLRSEQLDDNVPPYSSGLVQSVTKVFKRPGS